MARTSNTHDLGAWSIAYGVYTGVVGLSRAVTSTTMMVQQPTASNRSHHNWTETLPSTSAAAILGVGCTLLLLAPALAIHGVLGNVLLVFALTAPLWLFQDAARFTFFATDRGSGAALLDGFWLVLQIACYLLMESWDIASPVTLTMARCLTCGCVILSLAYWRQIPRLRDGASFLTRHRDLSARFTGEAALSALSAIALPTLLGVAVSLSAAGVLRAGLTVVGVVALVIMGLTPMATLEAGALTRTNPATLPKFVRVWSLAIAVTGAGYGAVILLIPDALGRLTLGPSWDAARAIMLPLILQVVIRGPFTGVPIALRASLRGDALLRLRVRTSIVNVVVPLMGGAALGLQGAVWSFVGATIINNIQSSRELSRTLSIVQEVS